MQYNEQFGRLLTEGIHLISIRKGLNIAHVEWRIGQAIGRNGKNPGSAIQYWKRGHVPAKPADLDGLVHHMVEWEGLSQQWAKELLRSIRNLHEVKLSGEISATGVFFDVSWLKNGQEEIRSEDLPLTIRREDLPLAIGGKYSPINGLHAWTLLEDAYKNYYLQDSEIRFLPQNVWIAENIIPGLGIKRIHFVMVDESDHATFRQMAASREWGAFKKLPPSSIKLVSVEITRG